MQARFLKSAAGPEGFPDDAGAEVAFVGRSNSGKSSAINRITGRTNLARVSKTPGRTRLINFFELAEGSRLVDLPGYGFARVPDRVREDWRALIDGYFARRRSLEGLILTADIRRGLKDSDETMLAMAAELEIPVAILLTKSDKLSRSQAATQALGVRKTAGDSAAVILFSALNGTGVEEAGRQLLGWLRLESGR
ncbi:MAG TPA: ribosome biogenesis GTP-binding protein YihA/YsxC [Gammaproteobacteria bacterium]|nr:ribosome biogenesis GTP-binding protein YihA/YsxC [Gammaproteobacteria bacterium]